MAIEFRGVIYSGPGALCQALYEVGEEIDLVGRDWWGWKVSRKGDKIQLWRYRGMVPDPERGARADKLRCELVSEKDMGVA